MVPGTGKISGHSGTSQKPTKRLENRKRLNYSGKSNFHVGRPINEIIVGTISKKIKVTVLAISTFAFVCIGKLLSIYFEPILGDNTKIEYLRIAKENKEEINREAYNFLINSANLYLKNNALDLAQNEYSRAIKLKNENKLAYLGFTEVLIEQCNQKGIYCEKATEYLLFISKSKIADENTIQKLQMKLIEK